MMFSEQIFVDTSAWLALADKDDDHHRKAAAVFPAVLKTRGGLVTSNLVVAETYILLLKELGHPAAFEFLERVKTSPRIRKVYSNEHVETDAGNILKQYGDHDFSYTDAVSFVVMKKQNIKTAFSFDKHFKIAGFTNIP